MNVRLFSHNDTDGYGPKVLLNLIPEIITESSHHTYETINIATEKFLEAEEYKHFDYVFFTDISLSETVAKKINNLPGIERHKFFLFDHHATAIWMRKYSWAKIADEEEKTCGTKIFHEFLLQFTKKHGFYKGHEHLEKQIVYDYVESIRLYDTWEWTLVNEQVLNKYKPVDHNTLRFILGPHKYEARMTKKLIESDVFDWDDAERFLLEVEKDKRQDYLEKKLKSMQIIRFEGYKAAYVFAENYQSDLGSYIMENNKEHIDLVIIITAPVKISLRTNKESVDVSILAKKYGGGGHKYAAGFSFTKENLLKIISS